MVSKQAKTEAMPTGDVMLAAKPVLAPVVAQQSAVKPGNGAKKEGDKSQTGRQRQQAFRPRIDQNDCSGCDLDICKSRQWAKNAGESQNWKKYCLAISMPNPDKLPNFVGNLDPPITKSELTALRICQAAVRHNPLVKLKGTRIRLLQVGNGNDIGNTADGAKPPLGATVASMSLRSLLGEGADEVTDPVEFSKWAESLGLDIAAPMVGQNDDASIDNIQQTPRYWAPVADGEATERAVEPTESEHAGRAAVAAAVSASEVEFLRRLDEMQQNFQAREEVMRQEIAQLQQSQIRASAPSSVTVGAWTAPAPPTTIPEHMRPQYSTTPVANSALASMRVPNTPSLASIPEATDRPGSQSSERSSRREPSSAELMANGVSMVSYALAVHEREHRKLLEKAARNSWYRPIALVSTGVQAVVTAVPAALDKVSGLSMAMANHPWPTTLFLLLAPYVAPSVARRLKPVVSALWSRALQLLGDRFQLAMRAVTALVSAGVLKFSSAVLNVVSRMLALVSVPLSTCATVLLSTHAAAAPDGQLGGAQVDSRSGNSGATANSHQSVRGGNDLSSPLANANDGAASQIAAIGEEILTPMVGMSSQRHEILQARIGMIEPRVSANAGLILTQEDQLVAALPVNAIPAQAEMSDNGATTGVAKTKLGLIPGTSKPSASGGFTVGNNVTLQANETFYFAYYRCGTNGKVPTLRRRHLAPDALCNIGSEGEDVYFHGQSYWFAEDVGRVLYTARDSNGERQMLNLHMSANNLGWYWMEEITDPSVIRQLLKSHNAEVITPIAPQIAVPVLQQGGLWNCWPCVPNVIDGNLSIAQINDAILAPINPHTGVSMSRPAKLSGYEILCRMHIVMGHAGLATLLHTLSQLPGTAGMITREDVEQFRRRGCGICDSTIMTAPPFPRADVLQPDPAPGQYWVSDTVSLRTVAFGSKASYMTVYVDKGSVYWLLIDHQDYTAETVVALDQQLRTFNRPINGEVLRIKRDNHPSYKAKKTAEYLRESEIGANYSVNYGHHGVGDAEVVWRVAVPRSNALLRGCAHDGGEEHENTAMFTVAAGHNDLIAPGKSASPTMVFFRQKEPVIESQCAYGAPVKYLTFPEARDSKFDDHAEAGTYRGPSRETLDVTPKLCWVLTETGRGKQLVTVHMGCVRVDERPVIARSTRSHPSHQPYGDPSVERAEDKEPDQLDFSMWRNVLTEGYTPQDASVSSTAIEAPTLPAPRVIWQPSMLAPDTAYVVGICSGESGYPADLNAIVHAMSQAQVLYIPIDKKVGGHAHHLLVDRVVHGLRRLVGHEQCRGVGFAPPCNSFTALLCIRPGPRMLFTQDEKMGVAGLTGNDLNKQQQTIALYSNCIDIARTAHNNEHVRFIWWEGPVARGTGSPFAIVGQESHLSSFEYPPVRNAMLEFSMKPVYVDQGPFGAEVPKTTAVYCTGAFMQLLDGLLGTAPVVPGDGTRKSQGFDGAGVSKAACLAKYPLEFRVRLGYAMVRCALGESQSSSGGAVAEDKSTPVAEDKSTPIEAKFSGDAADQVTLVNPKADNQNRNDAAKINLLSRLNDEAASDNAQKPSNHDKQSVTEDSLEEKVRIQQELIQQAQKDIPVGTKVDVKWADSYQDQFVGVVKAYYLWRGEKGKSRFPRARVLLQYEVDGKKVWHDLETTDVASHQETEAESQVATTEPVFESAIEGGEKVLMLPEGPSESELQAAMEQDAELALVMQELMACRSELVASLMECKRLGAEAMADMVSSTLPEGAYDLELPIMDIESGELLQVLSTVVSNGNDAVLIAPNEADRWHLPRNEREYLQSPHRNYWRTGKEIKMEKYRSVPSWEVVSIKTVPKGTRIFRMQWVHAMREVAHQNATMLKFNPRLCVVGTGMDPTEFPSYSDVARDLTLNIITCVYVAHMESFEAYQADDDDAFQNTITDGSDGDTVTKTLYSYQAPGFEEKSKTGETLVYKHRTAFQGRIDSPRLYGNKVKPHLRKAGWHAFLYDPEAFVYHEGPTKGTAASIPEILDAIKKAEPSPPGHAPVGYGLMIRHVDDKVTIVTSRAIMDFLVHTIAVSFVCKYTGWRKVLGWDVVVNKQERTVCFEAPTVLEAAKVKFLQSTTYANNRHVMMPSIMQLEAGEVPPVGHPERDSYLIMQRDTGSLQGLAIWLAKRYPQILFVTRKCGQHAANPSWGVWRALVHMLMHLLSHPYATHFGGKACRSLELSAPIKQPYSTEDREWGLYYMADASVGDPSSMTSVVGMLAGTSIDNICQRQHCKSGESATSEIVAGGTAMHRIIMARGIIQEAGYPQEFSTVCYFDSSATIFAANDDTSSKRSMWLRRRVAILREGVDMGEMQTYKIPEADNAADMHTKYLTFSAWKRHHWFINNLNEARCAQAKARLQSVMQPPAPSPPASPPSSETEELSVECTELSLDGESLTRMCPPCPIGPNGRHVAELCIICDKILRAVGLPRDGFADCIHCGTIFRMRGSYCDCGQEFEAVAQGNVMVTAEDVLASPPPSPPVVFNGFGHSQLRHVRPVTLAVPESTTSWLMRMVASGTASLLRASADIVCPPFAPVMGYALVDDVTSTEPPARLSDLRPPTRLHAALEHYQRQTQTALGPDIVVVYVFIKRLRGAYSGLFNYYSSTVEDVMRDVCTVRGIGTQATHTLMTLDLPAAAMLNQPNMSLVVANQHRPLADVAREGGLFFQIVRRHVAVGNASAARAEPHNAGQTTRPRRRNRHPPSTAGQTVGPNNASELLPSPQQERWQVAFLEEVN